MRCNRQEEHNLSHPSQIPSLPQVIAGTASEADNLQEGPSHLLDTGNRNLIAVGAASTGGDDGPSELESSGGVHQHPRLPHQELPPRLHELKSHQVCCRLPQRPRQCSQEGRSETDRQDHRTARPTMGRKEHHP